MFKFKKVLAAASVLAILLGGCAPTPMQTTAHYGVGNGSYVDGQAGSNLVNGNGRAIRGGDGKIVSDTPNSPPGWGTPDHNSETPSGNDDSSAGNPPGAGTSDSNSDADDPRPVNNRN